jgi:DNA-binding response OmpR family regulator
MSTSPKKEKILVIEGEVNFGKRIVDALEKEGYTASLETDGTAGLKAIYDILPHLILVDIILPGTDGYKILEKKQAEPLLVKIPVFLISTQGVPINMARIPQGSVKEFILDLHADTQEIIKRVNTLLGYVSSKEVKEDSVNRKKIVWVEDDKLIGTILSKKLTASGFDLYHAKDGTEAMRYLANNVPDAIVLDLLMPGMSGFDILQKIKADPRLKDVPAMILSNLNKQSDIDRTKILGAQKFLVKAAASLDQIVGEVKNLCR